MKNTKRLLWDFWKDKKFVKQNVLTWLVLLALFCAINLTANGFTHNSAYVEIGLATLVMMIVFYTNFFLCALFLGKKNKLLFLWGFIFFAIFFLLMMWMDYNQYQALKDKRKYSFIQFAFLKLFLSSIYYFLIAAIAITYWSLRNAAIKKKENEITQIALSNKNASLEAKTLSLQKELLQSENNFLRAQINPHFLYNSLNFLYSKTFQDQPEVAETIMMLSQIMRYSLADFTATNGLALLEDEIKHIENLIKINSFRFANSLQIKLKVDGDEANKFIAPMLFITLVENVFKHGNLKDANNPAVITCAINSTTKKIQFTTVNKKDKTTINQSSNLGLANITQRLKILYNDNFTLHTEHDDIIFASTLVIPYFDNFITHTQPSNSI
jgi:sensor histidine kinase YesM